MNKIYKLVYNGVVVYVGKTKQTLKRRKKGGYKGNPDVQAIYKECDMVLIEETSDVSRERYWIEYYKESLLNIRPGETGLSKKEQRKQWKESNREYFNQWEEVNKERRKEQRKEYYQCNKERINQQIKESRESNREKIQEYQREYYKKNKIKNGTAD